MVSLDLNSIYLNSFSVGTDLDLYRKFLAGTLTLAEQDTAVSRIVDCLLQDNPVSASLIAAEYSEKHPDSSSQFIYKDLLIFLLICMSKKYALDTSWIIHFLNLRRSDEDEKNKITTTFRNIINDNRESNENLMAIIVVYEYLQGGSVKNENILNSVIDSISLRSFPVFESDFLNVTTIRAVELIVTYKGLGDFAECEENRQFVNLFFNRTKLVTAVFCSVVLASIIIFTFYFSYVYLFEPDDRSAFAGKILTLLGIALALITLMGITSGKKVLDFLTFQLRRLLGYQNML